MSADKIQFQSTKRIDNARGLLGAFCMALKDFLKQVKGNLRYGKATVHVTVAPVEDQYFAIMLAGPFENLETLKLAVLAQATDPHFLEHLKRVGLDDAETGEAQSS